MSEYFKDLKREVDNIYLIANEARGKGCDPEDRVEIPLAASMAEKVVGLISTIYPQIENVGIAERIVELEKQYGKLNPTVVFKIAEEISEEKYCEFDDILQSIDAGIRVGFAYSTLGVVSSPIEGYTGIKTQKTREGKDYLVASFSGPIRSAGTTSSCLVLILIDFLREKFGFSKYDPTEEEIKRVYAELNDFHERVTNLQYMPTEEEAFFIAKNMPIQVSGDPSEKLEVSNYKNLERVNTNYLRSGFCLIMGEGLSQKAAKGFRLLGQAKENGVVSTGFDWLKEYIEMHEKRISGKSSEEESPVYIKDLVAGRPVFSHPSESGGFRFRYGRGRNSGFSSVCVHPATMGVTNDFIATGTQLKIEKPTKGCVVAVCDEIEGPIVKLKDGSVLQLKTKEEAEFLYDKIEEIIYLGDILFPYSDILNRNANLISPGYVEEWWNLELHEKGFSGEIDYRNISFEKAIDLSQRYGVSMYPKYIYYWNEINKEEFLNFIDLIRASKIEEKIILPLLKEFSLGKRALEKIGIPHRVVEGEVVIDELDSKILLMNLGIDSSLIKGELKDFVNREKYELGESVLDVINKSSRFEIRDKSGEFIGARMGRPEKAKLRKVVGSPNSLFVLGNEGGRLKTFQSAIQKGEVNESFPTYYCSSCEELGVFKKCIICSSECDKKYYFRDTKEILDTKKSENSEYVGVPYNYRNIDIRKYFEIAVKNLGLEEAPEVVKGIKRTTSSESVVERIEKGILRSKYSLVANKDGTIRMDATELSLVSFRPKEIGTTVEKLKELGYFKDVYGKDLIDDNQILELKPHDILIPSSVDSPDEKGEDVFVNICNFIDELLVKFYKMKPLYNIKTKEDLVGQMGVCMAPHNCAGVVCRFIGFSNTLGVMASPFMHAAIRRDCDGDEAAIMLLSDVLLNFSRKFLPAHRGGTQDAPLVLNTKIDAGEVDDQILDFECVRNYPIDLYEKAALKKHSSEVEVKTVRDVINQGEDPFVNLGFTHNTENFNLGVACSSYKTIEDMQDKVWCQMELAEKIRAVDLDDVARLVVERHFIRDIKGNLRKFSMQTFRCVDCNEIYRRPPLVGKCVKCSGKLIFTVHEGGIKKYLDPAIKLSEKYNLSPYLKESLILVKKYIDSIFGKEQKSLEDF